MQKNETILHGINMLEVPRSTAPLLQHLQRIELVATLYKTEKVQGLYLQASMLTNKIRPVLTPHFLAF